MELRIYNLYHYSVLIHCFFFFISMTRSIRRSFLQEMYYGGDLLKAIAFVMLVRKRTNNASVFRNYSINQLSEATGLHHKTIRKRLRTLEKYGLVEYKGTTLFFKSITSKHKKRTTLLAKIDYTNAKTIQRSLQAILLVGIQNTKNYCKSVIRNATKSKNPKVVRAARRIARRYGFGSEYKEYGLSYRGMARKFGCCKDTAVKITNFAVKRKMVKKERHFSWVKVGYGFIDWDNQYTFCTKDYAFNVQANTYDVCPILSTNGMVIYRG